MTTKKINPNPPAPKGKSKTKQPAPKKAAPTTVAQQKLEEVVQVVMEFVALVFCQQDLL